MRAGDKVHITVQIRANAGIQYKRITAIRPVEQGKARVLIRSTGNFCWLGAGNWPGIVDATFGMVKIR